MDFLRDLLEASKKKKVSRTAASGVYHRDYEKTKKRPYRKYDAEKHAQLSEGSVNIYFDYTGAGRGPEPIAGPFKSEKEAEAYATEYDIDLTDGNHFIDKASLVREEFEQDGQDQPSGDEELGQLLKELVAQLAKYDQLKNSNDSPQKDDSQQNDTSSPLQFSSYLYSIMGTSLSEEKWQFNERPPQEGPGGPASVSDVGDNTDIAPIEPDSETEFEAGDLQSVKKEASSTIKQILDNLEQLGPDTSQQLDQLCAKHCGDKADRVVSVLTKAAQKVGIQL
jgi:hypothetical protein